MLSKAKVKFNYFDVNEEDKIEVITALQRENNYYKIPMIFLDEKFIGGYSDLKAMIDQKQIDLDEFK